jgi:alpha-1,3-rhamnosyl/mannosyltransferase
MANELPVVATRRAGLPEHLGDTGVWIRENDPEDLASKISELLQNDELRRGLSLRARQRAELYFNWDTIAEKTFVVYQKALQRKNGSE